MADYDTLKSVKDYAVDVAGILGGAVGAKQVTDEALEFLGTLIDIGGMTLSMTEDALAQSQYIYRVGHSYQNNRAFLDTIAQYSDNEELIEAAQYMRDTLDISLEAQVRQIGDITTDTLKIVKKHVFTPALFEKMKSTTDYAKDANAKALVDWSENTQKTLGSLKNLGESVYGLGIFAGDMLFGTTDTYKRYAEIKAVNEMITALKDAANSVDTMDVEGIAEIVPLLQSICLLRMRGEYCNYSLVTEDGQIMSFFNQLFGDTEAQENYYSRQSDWLLECWELLCAILVDVPQLMGNTNDNINNGGLLAVDPITGTLFFRSDSCREEKIDRFNYNKYSADEKRLGYAETTQYHYSIIRRDPDGTETVVADNACENPSLNVIGGWVYYLDSNYGYSGKLQADRQQYTERQYLRRMRFDGSENDVLIGRMFSRVWVTNDDIYAVGYQDDDYNVSSFDSASSKTQLLKYDLNGKKGVPMLRAGFEYQNICVDPAADEIFVGRSVTEAWGAFLEDVSEEEIADGTGIWWVKVEEASDADQIHSRKIWDGSAGGSMLIGDSLYVVCMDSPNGEPYLARLSRDGKSAEKLNSVGYISNSVAAPDGTFYALKEGSVVHFSADGEQLETISEGRKPHIIGNTLYYWGFGSSPVQSVKLKEE